MIKYPSHQLGFFIENFSRKILTFIHQNHEKNYNPFTVFLSSEFPFRIAKVPYLHTASES